MEEPAGQGNQYHVAGVKRHLDDYGADAIWQNMTEKHSSPCSTDAYRSFNVRKASYGHYLAADQTGIHWPPGEADGQHRRANTGTQGGVDSHGQDQGWESQKDVGNAHQDLVHQPAKEARHSTQEGAYGRSDQHYYDRYLQRDARSIDHAAINITP